METDGNTFANSIIGAIVTIVLVVFPLSPTLGGAGAGYLQGESRREGMKAGGLTGLFSTVPLFLIFLFLVPVVVIAPLGVPRYPVSPLVFVTSLLIVVAVYTIGFGIIGGLVGTYLAAARGG